MQIINYEKAHLEWFEGVRFFYCLMLHFIAHYVDSSFIFELLCYQSASFGLLLRVEKIKGPNPKIKAESLKIKTMAKKNLIIILE
jgi:UDP-N-acetylglucosamine pyrophosphorylase